MAGRYVKLAEGPILLAALLPGQAQPAVSIARTLGRLLEKRAELLHVADPPLSPREILGALELTPDDLGPVVVTALSGDPAQAVLQYARRQRGSLLVTCLGAEQELGGSVLERLLSEAPCPVLVVPPRVRIPWGHDGTVLLPLDGTPSTAFAVPWATELAVGMNAAIEIVYVAGVPQAREAGSLVVPSLIDAPQHDWPGWRREFLSRFCGCYWEGESPVELRLTLQTGDPAGAILRAADAAEPELVVVGWHGDLSPEHARTLRTLLRRARWPILTVRVPPVGAGES